MADKPEVLMINNTIPGSIAERLTSPAREEVLTQPLRGAKFNAGEIRERRNAPMVFDDPDAIRLCGICGLPTIIDRYQHYCQKCRKLLCVACREDGHVCNFGPPAGMPSVDF